MVTLFGADETMATVVTPPGECGIMSLVFTALGVGET